MRYVKISQRELENIKKLYESVMSNACHGLFYKEGSVFGAEIAAAAIEDMDNFFEIAKKVLKERNWVEDITFKKNKITVKGSIEVSKGELATCHRLRGILRHLTEVYRAERIYCVEKKCESMGDKACVFHIEPIK